MKWIGKAFMQNMLSVTPNGEGVNYFFQQHIVRTLPISEAKFWGVLEKVFKHIQMLDSCNGGLRIEDLKLFEFGAGWHLVGPLTYAAMGLKNQTSVDLIPHIRPELIRVTLAYLRRNKAAIEQKYGYRLAEGFFRQADTVPADIHFLRAVGIEYQAPVDARHTRLAGDSYDLIANTDTLEHIPPADLQRILAECRRILKPGGMLSCIIDLGDHFSYFDPSISVYNFLKFSDKTWESFFNPSFQYQNRLRAGDYLKLFEQAGFKVLAQGLQKPRDHEIEALRSLKLNKRFSDRDLMEDVAIKRLDVLLQKEK